MKSRTKKIKSESSRSRLISFAGLMVAFAAIGGLIVIITNAAPGTCSTTNVVGSATYTINAPETAQYRLWVRMQVPDTTNTNNTNGVRVQLAGSSNQCFTVTTTNTNAVNQWQWVNTDATVASTPHLTSQINAGNYTATILGLKSGVKVDKVLLLRSDNVCTPSNNFTNGSPGDNCTTAAPTVDINANPTTVTSGGTTTLNWTSTNATSCTGSGTWGSSTRPTSSTSFTTSALTSAGTFTITCVGVGGSASDSVTVQVTPPPAPTVTLTASITTILTGSSTSLTWTSTNATTCASTGGSNGWANANRASTGTFNTGNLTSNQTYNLSCTGTGGTTNATPIIITVTVTPPPNDTAAPVITMAIPNVVIPSGQSTVVVRNQRSISWQPQASDASGIRSLVVSVNGQSVSLNGGAYVFGGTLAQGNGDYTLSAVATDNANNVTTVTQVIRLRHPDINRDNLVDSRDLTPIIIRWGKVLRGETVSAAEITVYDLNTSGTLNSSDMTPILIEWGRFLRGEVQ